MNDLIRTELEAEGHLVRQAHDGPTALELVREQVPQLVILDWMLPGLDGLSVCRQLRQDYLMPIIMPTARSACKWARMTPWSSRSGCASCSRARARLSAVSSSRQGAASPTGKVKRPLSTAPCAWSRPRTAQL